MLEHGSGHLDFPSLSPAIAVALLQRCSNVLDLWLATLCQRFARIRQLTTLAMTPARARRTLLTVPSSLGRVAWRSDHRADRRLIHVRGRSAVYGDTPTSVRSICGANSPPRWSALPRGAALDARRATLPPEHFRRELSDASSINCGSTSCAPTLASLITRIL
jgi:hypothetical protein